MINLMIADDNIQFTEYLSNMLTKEKDIKIINISYDGLSAIKNYNELKPDVLLLDLHMPGCSGIEVLENIHKYTRMNNIIILSGSNEWRSKIHNTSKFDWSYLKTIDPSQLLQTIKKIALPNKLPQIEDKLDNFFNNFLFDNTKNTTLVKAAILTIMDNPNIELDNAIKRVAAQKCIKNYKTAYQSIYRCISTAIKRHTNFNEFKDILPLAFRYNPTPKNFIIYTAKYLEKMYN